MSNSLLIIDAHAVLHRAFHALPPLTNKQREPVGAVFGFFSVLLSTLKKIKPRKLAICFDSPGPTFRHKLFIGYQSKRPITEDRLVSQIKKTRKLVAESGLAYFIKSGFEADDLVASLAKKNQASKIYILTGDKDLMQLVDKKVNLLLMGRQMNKLTKVNSQEVKKILGIKPSQVVDFKALSGDPSDNYPGVYGVGPKTASSLLEKFQNFDNVYQNLNKLPDALKMKLKKGKEAGELSYRLAKIDNQTPIKLKGKQLAWKNAKIKELKEVLAKESFPSLVKRIEKDFGLIKKENCQQKLL